MSDNPDDVFLLAWKQQLDAGFSLVERVLENAIEVCERQLEAATEAHADVEATRKSVAAARDAAEVNKLCTEWLRANLNRSAGCCRSGLEVVAQLAVPGSDKPAESVGAAELAPPAQALLGFMDSAYKAWLEAAQQLYELPKGRAAA